MSEPPRGGAGLEDADPGLALPQDPEGVIVELSGHRLVRQRDPNGDREAGEVYEHLRRDLERVTGRQGRPWHMLTAEQREQWVEVLKTMDPLRRY